MPSLKRCLLIALMLVLLPLRGWAGHVMAVDMAAMTVATANAASQAAMPADCAMQMQTAGDDTASTCSNCDTCELCLAVANTSPALLPFNPLVRHPLPLVFSSGFFSVASASNDKPPIF
jgi:hypothetical protein